VEEELKNAPGAPVDVNKVVWEFRNLLEQGCETLPSFDDDHKAQTMKAQIEKMQKKALGLKSNLQKRRASFIAQIQTRVEEILEKQRPIIEQIDVDEALKLSLETENRIRALDETIEQVEAEFKEVEALITDKLRSCNEFGKAANEFLRSEV
jgi:phosphoenolpyruvate-protein kinase (PTS system EI component)